MVMSAINEQYKMHMHFAKRFGLHGRSVLRNDDIITTVASCYASEMPS